MRYINVIVIIMLLILIVSCSKKIHIEEIKCKVYRRESKIIRLQSKVQAIDLSDKKLQNIPSYIFNLKNVIYIDLSYNDLAYVSDSICELKKLKTIKLNSNDFKEFPKNLFCKNSKLNHILINNNEISQLPDNLSETKKLKSILIFNNNFDYDSIRYYQKLYEDINIVFDLNNVVKIE